MPRRASRGPAPREMGLGEGAFLGRAAPTPPGPGAVETLGAASRASAMLGEKEGSYRFRLASNLVRPAFAHPPRASPRGLRVRFAQGHAP